MTESATSSPGLAVVTGASTGIGRAFASLLAEQGYDLVIAADEPLIHEVASDLRREDRRVVPVEADLADASGVEWFYDVIAQQSAPVSIGILNAGIGAHGRFDEIDLGVTLKIIDLNVRSTVQLATLLTRDMVATGDGRLLFVASIAGKAPGPFHAAYAASKAFVHSFAEAARNELRGTGVSVTSLLPGPTDTEFFARADMEQTTVARSADDSPEEVAREGLRALMQGKDQAVAGAARNTVQAAASAVLPDRVAAAAAARMTEPHEIDERTSR